MMSRTWNRLLRRLAVLLGAGLLLQATSCQIFSLPTAQDLVNFTIAFGREALAGYLL